MIQRSKRYSVLDVSDDQAEPPKKSYCQYCLNLPVRRLVILSERQYPDLKPEDPLPPDHDNWKQCLVCGRIVPIHNTKQESKLQVAQGYTSDSENPFDSMMNKQYITGVDRRLSTKNRLERRRKEEELADIKDPDARDLIRQGKKLLSYYDDDTSSIK